MKKLIAIVPFMSVILSLYSEFANAGARCKHISPFKIAQVVMKVETKSDHFILKETGQIFSRVCVSDSEFIVMWFNKKREKYKWGEKFAKGVKDDEEARKIRFLDEKAFSHYAAYKLYMLQVKEFLDKDAYNYLLKKLRNCRYLLAMFSYQVDEYTFHSELYCAKEPGWFLERPLWEGPPKMTSTN